MRDAAVEKKGGFFASLFCHLTDDNSVALLSDGNTAYILGELDKCEQLRAALLEIPHGSVLGKAEIVRSVCLEKEYFFIPKDFAFFYPKNEFLSPSLPNSISIKPVHSIEELHDFCSLKSAFFFEESGTKVEADDLIAHLKKGYMGIKPVTMRHGEKVIGMVSSNLNSRQSAMINMLYIAKEARAKGYGTLLLRWYMSYLLESSQSLCLFCSPNNTPAVKLYYSLGFQREEDWILALKA